MNFSPEIFIEICSFLPPGDLFTLSQVCRKFRGYLCAPNSFVTQQIWKESRLNFMPKEDMPPPEGMSEEKYAELLMTERGCQICKRTKECKIYWEFAIRCCKECHSNKTVSRIRLIDIECPSEFVDIMPYTHTGFTICNKYYWKEQLDSAYSQYYGLSKKKKEIWLNNKKQIFDSIMNYVNKRELREIEEREKLDVYFCFYHHPHLFHTCCDLHYSLLNLRIQTPTRPSRPSRSPLPPLSRFFVKKIKDTPSAIPKFLQFHIQRLENVSHQSSSNASIRLNSVNNFLENSNEQKRDNFIKTKKKKDKRELNNKFNRFSMKMKGKNSKNKFAHKYG
ncbi:unnamed protein product [Rhizophagus irregularis]|nr:unnamed protein product [Rhizophagus irregularis]CAB5362956.1 unnamed protein product [Rhizophagus irregularis]